MLTHAYSRRLIAAGSLSLSMLFVAGCNRDPNVRKQKYLESGQRYETAGKLREAGIQFSNALKIDHNYGDAHFELAKVYLQMGSVNAAYSEFLRTVDLSPNNIKARLDLGNLSLVGGRADLAQAQAKAILALQPNNSDAFALLASIAAHNGDRVEAEKQIRQAISLTPNRAVYHSDPAKRPEAEQELNRAITIDGKDVLAHLALAALLEQRSDFDGTQAQLVSAVSVAPKSLEARQALVGFYIRRGNTAAAEQTTRQTTIDFADTEKGAAMLADYYIRTGQLDKAENAYAQLSNDHPKSFQLNYQYARILVLRHKDSKVPAISAILEKLGPNSPQTHIVQSSILVDAGKIDAALDNLKKAVADTPDDAQLHLAYAKVALTKGSTDVAATQFHEAARLNPRSIESQAGLAQIAERGHDTAGLLAAAQAALTLEPNYAPAYMWRASAETTQKQYAQAEVDVQTSLQKQPDNPEAYVELAQIHAAQQQLPQAATFLQKALDLDPGFLPAINDLVRIYMFQKHPEQAVAAIQAQIAKVPSNPLLYVLLTDVLASTRDFQGAAASAQKAYQIDPTNIQALTAYSKSIVQLGHPEQAITLWTDWVAKHPTDDNATSMLGELEDRIGNKPVAMQYYQKSLQINPNQFWALNNLAYLMLEQHQNLDVALSLAQQARTQKPHNASTGDTLAWVYYAKGMYGSSRDLLEDAAKSDPTDAAIQYHLGMAYSKLGDRANAATHLKKALALAQASKDDATAKNAQTAIAQL
ncbi:MAG: tetratricopeptide repeat protein [Acidobacteriota bacterium]